MWTGCVVGVNGTLLAEEHEGVLWQLGYSCIKAQCPKGVWSRAAKVHAFIISARDGGGLLYCPPTFQSRGRSSRFPLFKRLAESEAECQLTYIEMQITEKSLSLCVFASPLKPYVECEVTIFAVTRNYSSVSGFNFYYRIMHPCLNWMLSKSQLVSIIILNNRIICATDFLKFIKDKLHIN